MSHPALIDTPEAFDNLVDDIAKHDVLAFDIESNGFYHFYEKTCILTVSVPGRDAAIDSLKLWDQMPKLAEIFSAPSRKVIAHGASYDVMSLKRDFDFSFGDLVDTMIAAQLLDHPKVGLADLARQYFDIDMAKELQRYNWAQRPILEEHMEYLLADTRHLFELSDLLHQELEAKDLTEEYRIECQVVADQVVASTSADDPEGYWRIKDSRKMSPQQRGVLAKVFNLRRGIAQDRDLASFRILNNSYLVSLAIQQPTSREDLLSIKGGNPRLLEQHADRFLDAIKEGLNEPVTRPPRDDNAPSNGGRPSPQEREFSKQIKSWRSDEAQRRGVGIQAILPTPILNEIVKDPPRDRSDLKQYSRFGSKRMERYGDTLVKLASQLAN